MSKKPKDQQWFNDTYSKVEVINIIGSRRLNLAGSLTIKDFKNLKSN